MKVSLILATINRTDEMRRVLESLQYQTYQNFELIVVDQNQDNRLVPILTPFAARFPLKHLRSRPGLSRARNLGINHASGDIVAFPDDDCWYAPELLQKVVDTLRRHPEWSGLAGRTIDPSGHTTVTRFAAAGGLINKYDVWRKAVSCTLFLRMGVLREIGGFDETLGLGAGTLWGSGEDTDLPLRAVLAGYKLYYDPTLTVFHPQPISVYNEKAIARGMAYGAGMGRVLRKHQYPMWFVLYQLARPIVGAAYSLLAGQFGRSRYYWAVFRGRLTGWLSTES